MATNLEIKLKLEKGRLRWWQRCLDRLEVGMIQFVCSKAEWFQSGTKALQKHQGTNSCSSVGPGKSCETDVRASLFPFSLLLCSAPCPELRRPDLHQQVTAAAHPAVSDANFFSLCSASHCMVQALTTHKPTASQAGAPCPLFVQESLWATQPPGMEQQDFLLEHVLSGRRRGGIAMF